MQYILGPQRGHFCLMALAPAGRVIQIAPNRVDALRDSAIRRNVRLSDSAILQFGYGRQAETAPATILRHGWAGVQQQLRRKYRCVAI